MGLGLTTAVLLDPFKQVETDQAVNHLTALGRAHLGQGIEVPLLCGTGDVEHIESEAKHSRDFLVDRFGPNSADLAVNGQGLFLGALDQHVLAADFEGQRRRQILVVAGQPAQG